jgi:hypothetical protein
VAHYGAFDSPRRLSYSLDPDLPNKYVERRGINGLWVPRCLHYGQPTDHLLQGGSTLGPQECEGRLALVAFV